MTPEIKMQERDSFATRVVGTIVLLVLLSINSAVRSQAESRDELFPVGWKGKIEDAHVVCTKAEAAGAISKSPDQWLALFRKYEGQCELAEEFLTVNILDARLISIRDDKQVHLLLSKNPKGAQFWIVVHESEDNIVEQMMHSSPENLIQPGIVYHGPFVIGWSGFFYGTTTCRTKDDVYRRWKAKTDSALSANCVENYERSKYLKGTIIDIKLIDLQKDEDGYVDNELWALRIRDSNGKKIWIAFEGGTNHLRKRKMAGESE
jgi:hypothetical protein